MIRKVGICGGTHGNELTGVYLVKHIREEKKKNSSEFEVNGIEVQTILGNEKAISMGRRYVDTDLNRCFVKNILEEEKGDHKGTQVSLVEHERAREIYQQWKDVDVLIDMHNTTTDMGMTLIFYNRKNDFLIHLIKFLQDYFPGEVIYPMLIHPGDDDRKWRGRGLTSICENGIGIEIGPLSHGTLNWNIFTRTKDIIKLILKFCEFVNKNGVPKEPASISCYRTVETIDFPRDAQGEITGIIHPQVKNYEEVREGDAIFMSLDGKEIAYQDKDSFYPAFVSEASYLEKGIAFWKTRKELITTSQ